VGDMGNWKRAAAARYWSVARRYRPVSDL